MEIYLYYRYPNGIEGDDKLLKFFREDSIPAIFTDRVNNEYSHLCGVFERGASPIEVPEMKTVAQQIISKVKDDADQYSALLQSIGVKDDLLEKDFNKTQEAGSKSSTHPTGISAELYTAESATKSSRLF